MPGTIRRDSLNRAVAGLLRTVPVPSAPVARTLLWLLAGVVPVVVLVLIAGRLTGAPSAPVNTYLLTSTLGSAATAVLAALAAFELAQPGRPARWALLPVPAAVVWFAATGAGCVGTLFAPDSWGNAAGEAEECLRFILLAAAPLSVVLFGLQRRRPTPRPRLVGLLGGVAAAAAAVSLLALVHPHDSALPDLLSHGLAVAVVVAANAALAGRPPRRRAG